MGIGGMPLAPRNDKQELFKFIDNFNKIGDKIKPYGFKLTYHNHHFEFVRHGGKLLMDIIKENTKMMCPIFLFDLLLQMIKK